MRVTRLFAGSPAPVAPLPPQVSPRSVTFSMAQSATFSMAIDIDDPTYACTWPNAWTNGLPSSLGQLVNLSITGTPLTASLTPKHRFELTGNTRYLLDLRLSRRVQISGRELREDAFDLTNATIVKSQRRDRRRIGGKWWSNHYRLTVKAKDPTEDVTIILASRDCAEDGALCSAGSVPLFAGDTLAVDGAATNPTVSASDTEVAQANTTRMMSFPILLTNAHGLNTKIEWRTTTKGTATAGGHAADFRPRSGELVLWGGEGLTEARAGVVINRHADCNETVVIEITRARLTYGPYHHLAGKTVRELTVTDSEATGTIVCAT